MTLIELAWVLSITGMLMLITIRALHLATQVHESGIQTATHLRLVNSLEDRLRGDIARAREAELLSTDVLRLVMADSTEVHYTLVKPNVLERRILGRDAAQEAKVANQRWQFVNDYQMKVELIAKVARTKVARTSGARNEAHQSRSAKDSQTIAAGKLNTLDGGGEIFASFPAIVACTSGARAEAHWPRSTSIVQWIEAKKCKTQTGNGEIFASFLAPEVRATLGGATLVRFQLRNSGSVRRSMLREIEVSEVTNGQ